MADTLSIWFDLLLKAVAVLLAANEIRGLVLAGPVLYAMVQTGGTGMALWIGICSLAGLALSVVGPVLIARKLKLRRSTQPA